MVMPALNRKRVLIGLVLLVLVGSVAVLAPSLVAYLSADARTRPAVGVVMTAAAHCRTPVTRVQQVGVRDLEHWHFDCLFGREANARRVVLIKTWGTSPPMRLVWSRK